MIFQEPFIHRVSTRTSPGKTLESSFTTLKNRLDRHVEKKGGLGEGGFFGNEASQLINQLVWKNCRAGNLLDSICMYNVCVKGHSILTKCRCHTLPTFHIFVLAQPCPLDPPQAHKPLSPAENIQVIEFKSNPRIQSPGKAKVQFWGQDNTNKRAPTCTVFCKQQIT